MQFCTQIGVAVVDLTANGFVLRWQTLDRIGNTTVVEGQTILLRDGYWCATEAELVQGFIQQNSCMITGKWPPGCICPMHPRRQTNYQQPRIWVTKRRNRPGMVFRVLPFNIIQEICQAWAGTTINIKHGYTTYIYGVAGK